MKNKGVVVEYLLLIAITVIGIALIGSIMYLVINSDSNNQEPEQKIQQDDQNVQENVQTQGIEGSENCSLTEALWEKQQATFNEDINLITRSQNCESNFIDITIYSTSSDEEIDQINNIELTNNLAQTSWTIPSEGEASPQFSPFQITLAMILVFSSLILIFGIREYNLTNNTIHLTIAIVSLLVLVLLFFNFSLTIQTNPQVQFFSPETIDQYYFESILETNTSQTIKSDNLIIINESTTLVAANSNQCDDGIDNDNDGLTDWGYSSSHDPDCRTPFDSESRSPDRIQWEQIPEFTLPTKFKLFYQGFKVENPEILLNRGYTNIDNGGVENQDHIDLLSPEQRTNLWTAVASREGEPWSTIKSPWNNNLTRYHDYWAGRLRGMANQHSETEGQAAPNMFMLIEDVENRHSDDNEILSIKNHPLVPEEYRELSDEEFIKQYKTDMTVLYGEALRFAKSQGYQGLRGSYSDAPIRRKANFRIKSHSWEEWTTNQDLVDWLHVDQKTNQVGGVFDEELDYIFSSVYHLNRDYPSSKESDIVNWRRAGDYLGYLVFQAEANRAWTDKPIIYFENFRFHGSSGTAYLPVRPHMAHAMAIFPFFAGADGIWTWGVHDDIPEIPNYEAYFYGLYRLSQYNDILSGNFQTYMPEPATILLHEQKPVWRGIINQQGNKMLVAAQNPYAEPSDETQIEITYQGRSLGTITLQGWELYLGTFDI